MRTRLLWVIPLLLFAGCVSIGPRSPVLIPSSVPLQGRSYIQLNRRSGMACASFLFGFIPLSGTSDYSMETAYKRALEAGQKADGLIAVITDHRSRFWFFGSTACTVVHGIAIQFRRGSMQGSSSPVRRRDAPKPEKRILRAASGLVRRVSQPDRRRPQLPRRRAMDNRPTPPLKRRAIDIKSRPSSPIPPATQTSTKQVRRRPPPKQPSLPPIPKGQGKGTCKVYLDAYLGDLKQLRAAVTARNSVKARAMRSKLAGALGDTDIRSCFQSGYGAKLFQYTQKLLGIAQRLGVATK